MKTIRHFNIQTPNTIPPDNRSWLRMWYGNHRLTECWDGDTTGSSERNFEIDCFLSILAEIKKPSVFMIELGAGWGDWCLALDGVLKHKLIQTPITSYHCLAVEAEPKHFEWTEEHLRVHNIDSTTLHGAVSSRNGYCRFNTMTSPSRHYGQELSFRDFHSKQTILGLINLVRGKAITVPTYTLDTLICAFGQADIVQMDVQGAELKVIEGAKDTIEQGFIDYFLIGTHKREYNKELRETLEPKYECVVDLPPKSTNVFDGRTVECNDGIVLFQRKHNE